MRKQLIVAWVAVFALWMGGSLLVHGVLLHADYANLPGLMRGEAETQAHMPLMLLAHVLLAGAFVWIYSRGVEDKPAIPQGLRFGFAVALVSNVPIYVIHYVVQPFPAALVIKQVLYGLVLMMILGVAASAMIKPPRRAA